MTTEKDLEILKKKKEITNAAYDHIPTTIPIEDKITMEIHRTLNKITKEKKYEKE